MTAAERAALLAELNIRISRFRGLPESYILSALGAEVLALEAQVARLWDELAKADAAVLAMRGTGPALSARPCQACGTGAAKDGR